MLRVHVQVAERGRGDRRERVDFWPEFAQRRDQSRAVCLIPDVARFDHDERPPPQRLGDLGQRRNVEHASNRADLVRQLLTCPCSPRLEHLTGSLRRKQQRTGEDIRDWQ
jgi:hypothetical protein